MSKNFIGKGDIVISKDNKHKEKVEDIQFTFKDDGTVDTVIIIDEGNWKISKLKLEEIELLEE